MFPLNTAFLFLFISYTNAASSVGGGSFDGLMPCDLTCPPDASILGLDDQVLGSYHCARVFPAPSAASAMCAPGQTAVCAYWEVNTGNGCLPAPDASCTNQANCHRVKPLGQSSFCGRTVRIIDDSPMCTPQVAGQPMKLICIQPCGAPPTTTSCTCTSTATTPSSSSTTTSPVTTSTTFITSGTSVITVTPTTPTLSSSMSSTTVAPCVLAINRVRGVT